MRVLICGAGIAGPSLACFLKNFNIHVTIIEKSNAILSHGQSVNIRLYAKALVNKMGILDQVKQYHTTEKGSQLIDSKGKPFARYPVDTKTSFSAGSEILRGDLAAILYNATKDYPNITYMFGTTIQKVVSNDHSSVKVELSNGEIQEYDLLVAADGRWSNLRKECFPPECITVDDDDMYAIYWTVPRLPRDNDWWNIYHSLGSRIMTLRPDPHGTSRALFTHMPRSDAQKHIWREASRSDKKTQQELVSKEFADAGWQAQRLLDDMESAPDFHFQAIQQIRMSKWSSSRVVCLGDAAHAPSPMTAMGTSLAIIGAWYLAWHLNELKPDEHPARALEGYEKAHRPLVEKWTRVPSWVPGVWHPDTARKRWWFHAYWRVEARIAGVPWVKKMLGRKRDEEGDVGWALTAEEERFADFRSMVMSSDDGGSCVL